MNRIWTLLLSILSLRLYIVRGRSMEPSFIENELIVTRKTRVPTEIYRRGQIVIISDPAGSDKRHLKRIVGLPTEQIKLSEGMLFINGEHTEEPYLGGLPPYLGLDESMWESSKTQCFLMGDNRVYSEDSRAYGPVEIEAVRGVVLFRCWPLKRFGRVP